MKLREGTVCQIVTIEGNGWLDLRISWVKACRVKMISAHFIVNLERDDAHDEDVQRIVSVAREREGE